MAASEKLSPKAKFRNTFLALALTGATNGPIQASRQIEDDVLPAPTIITPVAPTISYFPLVANKTASVEAIPTSNFSDDRSRKVGTPRPVATAPVSELSLTLTPSPTRRVEQIEKTVTLEPIPTEIVEPTPVLEKQEARRPIYWGNRDNPEVAITFDDGFSQEAIKRTLEVLAENDIKGTFFVIGTQLRAYPELWQQALTAGHEICNHTYDHQYLVTLSTEQIKEELVQWEEAAKEVLGEEYVARMKQEFAYLRFPGGSGHNDERVLKAATEAGYWPIAWSQDTYSAVLKNHCYLEEPAGPIADEVREHTVGTAQNGSIILLHFNVWDTLYLDSTVRGLLNKGLQPTTVSGVLWEEPSAEETISEVVSEK